MLSAVLSLAACKVFDASLLDDDGAGSNEDGGVCDSDAGESCGDDDGECAEGTDFDTDEENCGGCGRVCTFGHANGECAAGTCANACESGWKDCNADDLDGCEADLASRATCGDCGLSCAFACSSGGCVTGSAVAAGRTWTCTTFSSGVARCWGNNMDGQLGTGDTAPSFTPRNVVDLSDASRVVAGFGHSCAIRTGRVASCWGQNDRGQLGDGTTGPRTVPVPVQLGNVDDIAVGFAHTCVRSDDDLYCWGFNDAGQLGFGDDTHRPQPEKIPEASTGSIADVSVGLAHSCAVRTGGEVICFGFNDQGQAGMPNEGDGGTNQVLSPNVVPGIDNAARVTLGHAHGCVLTTAGTVRCWGWNGSGQLGDGGFMSRVQPLFVIDAAGTQLSDITRLVAGAKRTCAIRDDGAAFCWGDNTSGALGGGPTPTQQPHAVRVTAMEGDILDIAVGELHTCFLGTLGIRCVGENQQGQLGDGTMAASSTGVDVSL